MKTCRSSPQHEAHPSGNGLWGSSPGPSACGADVMPLHHVPLSIAFVLCTCSQQNAAWQRDVLAARVQHATGPNIPHPCCIPVNMVLRVHLYQQPTYMPPMTATGDRPMSGLHYVAPGNRLQLGCGEARFIAHGVCLAGTFPFFPARRPAAIVHLGAVSASSYLPTDTKLGQDGPLIIFLEATWYALHIPIQVSLPEWPRGWT